VAVFSGDLLSGGNTSQAMEDEGESQTITGNWLPDSD
jgi:hypothetical protein